MRRERVSADRIVAAVARATRASDEGVTVSALASIVAVSPSHAAQILRDLRRDGIVRQDIVDGEGRWFLA